mgnify:CR=1 FL=1
MPYEPYVTYEYYCDAYKGTVIPMDELDRALKQASRHIDSLTYNRIVGRGFSNLSGKWSASRRILSMRTLTRLTPSCRATASTVCRHSSAAAGTYLQTKAWL